MNVLPPEILRSILREATAVPHVFEYPLDDPEVQEPYISRLIAASLTTKCALSLVSKLFHSVADEFLYEIIVLRRQRDIRPLVELLRRDDPSRANRPPLGWWCRRLELRLMYPLVSSAKDWEWGGLTLWGLLTTCTRIVDLRCSVLFWGSFDRELLPVSKILLQTLAQHHNGLRYLDIGGALGVPLSLSSQLLQYLPSLQVFVLGQVTWPPFTGMADEHNSRIICQDPDERDEYEDAKKNARWPSCVKERSTPVIQLPALCDLRLSPFQLSRTIIGDWQLPNLKRLTANYKCYTELCRNDLSRALQLPHLASITSLTFNGPPIDMWAILSQLPELLHLSIILNHHVSMLHNGRLQNPHMNLCRITLFRSDFCMTAIGQAVDSILEHAWEKKLPGLRLVRLWGDDCGVGLIERRSAAYAQMDIKMEIRETSMRFGQ